MKGVAAVGIAYLSWDSNDHPMNCQESRFLQVLERERERERERDRESKE